MRQVGSGDQCTACLAGTMQTRSVYDGKKWHTRYLVCDRCGQRSKQVIPIESVHRRKPTDSRKSDAVKQTGSVTIAEHG